MAQPTSRQSESGDVRALRIFILYSKGFLTWKERSSSIKLFSHWSEK